MGARRRPTAWCGSASPTTRSGSSATSCSSSCPTSATRSRPATPCGEVESTKSVSEIYPPVAGEVVAVNEALADEPELVNQEPYDDGWMFDLRPGGARAARRPARRGRLRPPDRRRLTDRSRGRASAGRSGRGPTRPARVPHGRLRRETAPPCRGGATAGGDREVTTNDGPGVPPERAPETTSVFRADFLAEVGAACAGAVRVGRRRAAGGFGAAGGQARAPTRARGSCSTAPRPARAATPTATSSSTTSLSRAGTPSSGATRATSSWSTSAA